jgi:cytochrome b561
MVPSHKSSTQPGARAHRYDNVAVLLHWGIAILILINCAIGLDFPERAPGQPFPPKPLLPLHISLGLSVLILSVVRVIWRLAHRPPPHPPTMQRWEILLAGTAHAAFYALIVAMPLTGWLTLSAHENAKWQSLFGIPWPPLPAAGDWPASTIAALHDTFAAAHSWLTVQILIVMLALHVGAVIKHHVLDKNRTLTRMLPRFSGSARS